VVEISQFDAVVEQHAISLPIEAIGQGHLAGRTFDDAVEVGAGGHGVSQSEIDLSFMRTSERMWFPQRHISILTDGLVSVRHRVS